MLSSSVWRGASQYWFILGLVIGGIGAATVIAALGSLLRPLSSGDFTLYAVGFVLLLVVLHEFGLLSLKLPQNARQVPERIAEAGPRFGAWQFGLEMGTGMRTFMTSAGPYALLVMIGLVASPSEFLLAGAGFGLGRALMSIARNSFPSPTDWDSILGAHDRHMRQATVVIVVALAALLTYGGAV